MKQDDKNTVRYFKIVQPHNTIRITAETPDEAAIKAFDIMNRDEIIEADDNDDTDDNDDNDDDSQEEDLDEVNPHLEAAKQLLNKLKNENQINNNPGNNGYLPTRYFKCVCDGESFGRFTGGKPKQAARKAFTSLLRQGKESPILFSLIECTRGCKHKEYKYKGDRIELDEPMKLMIGTGADAKEITYRYNNRIMKQH